MSEQQQSKKKASLPKLLAALASGARSVNSLPLSLPTNDNDTDSEQEDTSNDANNGIGGDNFGGFGGEVDEFAFHMAFPEVQSQCHETRVKLAQIVHVALNLSCPDLAVTATTTNTAAAGGDITDGTNLNNSPEYIPNIDNDTAGVAAGVVDFDDPLLWENAAEACDVLMDQVEGYIQTVQEGKLHSSSTVKELETLVRGQVGAGRNAFASRWNQVVEGTKDMEVSFDMCHGCG